MVRFPVFFQWLLPQVRWKWPTEHVVLTFDDGPHPDSTLFILDLLDTISTQAIFFVQGEQIEKYPDLLLCIHQKGHLIGNHGYTHHDPWFSHSKTILAGILKTEHLLNDKRIPSVGYRPPYGHWRPFWSNRQRFLTWLWSLDMKDYDPNNTTSDYIRRSQQVRSSDILLLHDNPRFIHHTLNILPILAEHCTKQRLILHKS